MMIKMVKGCMSSDHESTSVNGYLVLCDILGHYLEDMKNDWPVFLQVSFHLIILSIQVIQTI
jgi:hypothetical protein